MCFRLSLPLLLSLLGYLLLCGCTAFGIGTVDGYRIKYEHKGGLCLSGAGTMAFSAYLLSEYGFLDGVKHFLIGDGTETDSPEERNVMWWLFLTS